MLYDILIIDDDFDPEGDVLPIWDKSANKLLVKLIRKNLRVTWTSGEEDDVGKLITKDLSAIKYIFCDLYLKGISKTDSINVINSKIIGIIKKITFQFSEEHIIIYINSNRLDDNEDYRNEGIRNLKNYLGEIPNKKFSVEIAEPKNDLTPEQEEKLRRHSLGIYLKSMIINKAIEVEKILDHKLGLSKNKVRNMTFGEKNLCFQSKFLSSTDDTYKQLKEKINLLQKIRNCLAHENMDSMEFRMKENLRNLFWGIMQNSPESKHVKFEEIENIAKYIKSIDVLIGELGDIE